MLALNYLKAQQQSTAREWNEQILYAISADFARPTVHARNLFHLSIAMYDAWMVYEPTGNTYLLGKNLGDYTSNFNGVATPDDIDEAREIALSFAAFRLIEHRYAQSPGIIAISDSIETLMSSKGLDINNESIDYIDGGPAELGNFIASEVIAFGYTDGSNEADNYANIYYEPVNPPIEVEEPGNPDIIYPNRWQQISLSVSIDQSGEIVENAPPFLSPEWGNVLPFAMTDENKVIKNRDGHDYQVYLDPGEPALIDTTDPSGLESFYKWNFALVPVWQSHLDTALNVVWDVSPNSIGNIQSYPETQDEYEEFYNFYEGGDPGEGYTLNPVTGEPYEPQLIRRADYARVLAEFWADGPESVTPPGHWFKIYNEISDHPLFERKWAGQGPELDPLEYDIKAYLAIGGSMHDAAIAAWSVKGYYDYLRPVSAVRFMADRGQCTDPGLPNYHPAGIPLIPGYIELVEIDEPLAGLANQHAGKIKLYTWKGPDFIEDPDSDEAGVGWILAENWWPYQRPSFVTPPFAGYVSGHSTYSRTAAELLTLMTGSPFFPGGMSGFEVEQDEFLVFENGPSETFQLQWATYTDASDQCSLSRIWGGIHPPIDDIPGRKMGMELGPMCFNLADEIIHENRPFISNVEISTPLINQSAIGDICTISFSYNEEMDQSSTPSIQFENETVSNILTLQSSQWTNSTSFEASYLIENFETDPLLTIFSISGAENANQVAQNPFLNNQDLIIDTKSPEVLSVSFSENLVNDVSVSNGQVSVGMEFSEACNTNESPLLSLSSSVNLGNTMTYSESESQWTSESSFEAVFLLSDENVETTDISLNITNVQDLAGNQLLEYSEATEFTIDTKNPVLTNSLVNDELITIQDIGTTQVLVSLSFDEEMDTTSNPELLFQDPNPTDDILQYNSLGSTWVDSANCQIQYSVNNAAVELDNIVFTLDNFQDLNGNSPNTDSVAELFIIDTKPANVELLSPSLNWISDQDLDSGFYLDVVFSETMDTDQDALVIPSASGVENSLSNDFIASEWIDENTFRAFYNLTDQNIVIPNISVSVDFALDINGNSQEIYSENNVFNLDTENPEILSMSSSDYFIEEGDIGVDAFEIILIFQEAMDTSIIPEMEFSPAATVNEVLSIDLSDSEWLNEYTFKYSFDVNDVEIMNLGVSVSITGGSDIAGNAISSFSVDNFLIIDTEALSTADISSIQGIEIYPTIIYRGQELLISSEEFYPECTFKLFDSAGKMVVESQNKQLHQGVNSYSIPSFQSGLYLYEIRIENQFARGKLFVK